MDNVGFALENYNAVGLYRTTDDDGSPIDTSGLDIEGVPISDLATLTAALKENPAFPACVTRHLYSYAIGRAVQPQDNAAIEALVTAASDTGFELPALIHVIATSPAFLNHLEGQL
jgi:hypothetical protein